MKCLRKLELGIPWWPREDSLVDNLNVSYRLCLHYADRNLSHMDDALSSPARRGFTPIQKSRQNHRHICVNRSPFRYDFRACAKAVIRIIVWAGLVTESVGTTNLKAIYLPLVNEAGGQQIVSCIVLSLFLNDMVTICYPQIYHSSTIFSTEINQLENETHAGNQFAFNYFYCSFTF